MYNMNVNAIRIQTHLVRREQSLKVIVTAHEPGGHSASSDPMTSEAAARAQALERLGQSGRSV